MFARACLLAALPLLACGDSQGGASADAGEGPPPPEVVGVSVLDVTIPGSLHLQGLDVPAKLFVPELAGEATPLPGVLVLHGSGGLFRMPEAGDPGPCSPELEPQFSRWGQRLAERGYVALMPASFDARGFCDYDADAGRIGPEFDDDRERLLGRLYDVDAALRFFCGRAEVDCERLGGLGFSNGASTLVLAQHWQLARALTDFAASDGSELDVPVAVPPAGRPAMRVGVAYYPGCGVQGIVPFGVDPDDDPKDMYFSTGDLFIEHGAADSLVEDCSVAHGQGRRQVQSGRVAEAEARLDTYHVTVYAGAEHGFDNAGDPDADEGGGDRPEDLAARDAALAATLEHLAAGLGT